MRDKGIFGRKQAQSGFTLIELVLVVLIISVVAVMAIPKTNPTSINLEYEANRILADIRYTQLLSMTRGQRYRFVKTGASTYQILNQAGTAIVMPQGGTSQTLTTGITFSSLTNLPNNLLAFGVDGTPYVDTAISGTSLASIAVITLSMVSSTLTIHVSPQTGYGVLV